MFARTVTAGLSLTLALLPCGVAEAGAVRHARVVSADPVDHTPHVLDGIVNAFALVGDTVVVGGRFTQVQEAGGRRTLHRTNLFAFDLATGHVLPDFAPLLDGPVYALAPGAGGTVYVGGEFMSVNRRGGAALVRSRLSDGTTVPEFAPRVTGGGVSTMTRRGAHLYVGGDFVRVGAAPRTALARLDATTGAPDPDFTITPGRSRSGPVKVIALAATRDRLVVDGSFMTLDGLSRPQLGLIDISRPRATVAPWRTSAYAADCKPVFPTYVRGLDVSPDGTHFVVVTTGGPVDTARKLCDTTARFETFSVGDDIKPTWVNFTGGDSLYSVAVTGAAIYVGGHQRWLDNPHGRDSAGPGAVSRPGIGAIHPRTGKALSWNPTRERGIGVKAFLPHRGGLLVGSDTTRLGREYHARIGMFPLP